MNDASDALKRLALSVGITDAYLEEMRVEFAGMLPNDVRRCLIDGFERRDRAEKFTNSEILYLLLGIAAAIKEPYGYSHDCLSDGLLKEFGDEFERRGLHWAPRSDAA